VITQCQSHRRCHHGHRHICWLPVLQRAVRLEAKKVKTASSSPSSSPSSSRKSSSSSSSRQNRIPSLLEWAEKVAEIQWSSRKQQALSLSSATSNGAGLGFVAQQAVASSQVLLQVPGSVALTITALGQGPNDNGKLDKACRGANLSLKELPWYVQFSLYLSMLKNKTAS